MSFINKLIYFLQAEMNTPTAYGLYHIFCILVVIGASVFFGIRLNNADNKRVDKFLFTVSLIMIILEVYKQTVFSFNYNGGNPYWDYQWYAFPFQFCSTPMYVAFACSLIKNQKVKDVMYSFLGTFTLFAGAVVMVYPGDVFIKMIGIDIQTMFHHGGMVVIGVAMLTSGKCKLEHKSILKGCIVFSSLVLIALMLNCGYVWSGLYATFNETFNMFFISPYFSCTLPVLSMFYGKVPYVLFLMIYIFGFTLAGYIMLLIAMLVKKLSTKKE